MSPHAQISRRALLVAGAGTASVAVLAACSSSAAKPAGGGATTQSAGGGGSPATGGSGQPGKALAALTDIPVGEAISVTLPNGKPGILARPTATTAACFSAICTHMGCTVKPAKAKLDCPCHGSQYSATTGKVLRGPAPDPLPSVPVTVSAGKVVAT
jgi:cytochrome b6-f complex iron-sulfur subunit